MKNVIITIEVNAVMEKCKECPNFEVETLDLMGNQKLHRCKHIPYCSSIIDIWEEARKEDKKCPNNGTEEVVVDVFGHRYVKDHDKQGWTGVEVEKPHDYIVRNEYAESRRTAEEESVKFWGKASGRVVDNNGETLTWNEH